MAGVRRHVADTRPLKWPVGRLKARAADILKHE
jgi:hypothetical protein